MDTNNSGVSPRIGAARSGRQVAATLRHVTRRAPGVLAETWKISSVAATFAERMRLFAVALYMRAAWHIPFAPEPHITATVIGYRGTRLRVEMAQLFDVVCAWSVLRGGEYEVPFPPEADVIVDLGSNIGVSILDMRLRYPHAKIYGFEPDPAAFELLARNVANDPNVEILRVAVGASDGTTDFYAAKDTWASSLYPTRERQEHITVPMRSLDSLFKEFSIERVDLLKIDVEGAEDRIFGAASSIARVRWIVGELHLNILGCTAEEFFQHHLSGFAVVDQCTVDGFASFAAVARAA